MPASVAEEGEESSISNQATRIQSHLAPTSRSGGLEPDLPRGATLVQPLLTPPAL